MPTNEERREVAERLREFAADCKDEACDSMHFAMYSCWSDKGVCEAYNTSEALTRLADLIEPEPINGETSDGWHTFNELYHHRALLFSVVVRNYPDLCWKSKKHHTGDMYEGMFIVGINTPDGQASYHYDIEPYWDMFDCEEQEYAPEWDGHTPSQAIERIGKLTRREPERTCKCIYVNTVKSGMGEVVARGCSECRSTELRINHKYCPNCGAKVVSK